MNQYFIYWFLSHVLSSNHVIECICSSGILISIHLLNANKLSICILKGNGKTKKETNRKWHINYLEPRSRNADNMTIFFWKEKFSWTFLNHSGGSCEVLYKLEQPIIQIFVSTAVRWYLRRFILSFYKYLLWLHLHLR